MEKIIFVLLLPLISWGGQEEMESRLQQDCFRCHEEQKIPSEAIYRRYLLKYSSRDTIRKKMFEYLRHPSVQQSIMPQPFFNKFTIKEPSELEKRELQELIDAYVARFDVAGKLRVLPKK